MKRIVLGASLCLVSGWVWAECPAVTVADGMGVPAGAYPQQYDLADGISRC